MGYDNGLATHRLFSYQHIVWRQRGLLHTMITIKPNTTTKGTPKGDAACHRKVTKLDLKYDTNCHRKVIQNRRQIGM